MGKKKVFSSSSSSSSRNKEENAKRKKRDDWKMIFIFVHGANQRVRSEAKRRSERVFVTPFPCRERERKK